MSQTQSLPFNGRVAVIAGAAGGIGAAICERLARDGATVVMLDLNEKRLQALSQQIPRSETIAANLTQENEVDAAIAKVVDRHGRLDIFVHSVGITGPSLPVSDYPVAEWDRTLAINLQSAFLCARAVVKPMLTNGYGRIVNLASIAGKEGNANMCAYSVAKAGVIALTKSMGKELAQTAIRVNCIAPAVIQTSLVDQMSPELRATIIAKIPMGRTGQPEEVAALTAWLASEECSFSTGATYDLSGGRATY